MSEPRMMAREHPYASFLHRVKKPVQYLGGEPGEKRKDWNQVACKMCLAFPDLYEIGMSHLGYKILYGLINDRAHLLAERAFAPWTDLEKELRDHNERIRSLENGRPLSDFDIVGFSLQSELTYTNILLMLELGGIPRWSKDRKDDDPLVIAGGPVATHAEPLAPFIDAFLIGDGEHKATELMEVWADLEAEQVPRQDRLVKIAQLGGWYVPALYRTEIQPETNLMVISEAQQNAPLPVKRHIVEDLKQYAFPSDGPVASTETVFDRVSVEIARGCTEGCRFCQAGMIYRPVRERDPQDIINTITQAVDNAGYDEASLTSLSTADYSAIQPLVNKTLDALQGKYVNLSVSSLRAYGLSEEVLDDMSTQRAGGLTFAPEAGTQRMRDVVNKNVTEEQLMETAQRVFSRGWTKMKLYFMIGLPTEEEEDVRGIVQTGDRALHVAHRTRGKKDGRVTVSVSTFVPKPHTPFQWCRMDPYEDVLKKQEILRNEAKRTRVNLRYHDSRGSWLEAVLARGDRRVADAIAYAYDEGARFDSWEEHIDLDLWKRAFDVAKVDTDAFLGTLPVDARLPWDHLDVGLEDGFLAREYRRALKNRLSPPCGKPKGAFVHHTNLQDHRTDNRKLVCYHCGVACNLQGMKDERDDFLVKLGAVQAPPPSPLKVLRDTETREERKKRLERRPMQHVDQGASVWIRLAFTKLGRIAFSAHLDLVRLLPRVFRRLELPLYYTEGYNPHLQMRFSPALSLGISSLGEYLDLRLRKDELPNGFIESIVARLQAATMEGVTWLGVRELGPTDASISRVIDEATYVAGLAHSSLPELGLTDVAALRERLATRKAGELIVRRTIKGIGKKQDLKKHLVDVRVGEGASSLEKAGLTGALIPIRLVMRVDGGTPNPQRTLAALVNAPEVHVRIVRDGLYGLKQGVRIDPLDLEALRTPKTPVLAPEAAPAVL